jgi:uncharacterized coiled-coil protein SlyX
MPPKQNTADDLIIALRDPRVLEAIAGIFELKLQPMLDTITELKDENARKSVQIEKLQNHLRSVTSRVEELETYTRRDNLLIAGLPTDSFAEASATTNSEEGRPSQSVEQSVLNLFNHKLGVPIQPCDISIAHRLRKQDANDVRPPMTIVRFTNRKAREAVYGARRQLKNGKDKIFINEDLPKTTADLFRQARLLVRAHVIHSAWTSSCCVYIKSSSDVNCRPQKVSSLGDLPRSPG